MKVKDLIRELLEYDMEADVWLDFSYVGEDTMFEPMLEYYKGKVFIN